jgi:hypothetical protein
MAARLFPRRDPISNFNPVAGPLEMKQLGHRNANEPLASLPKGYHRAFISVQLDRKTPFRCQPLENDDVSSGPDTEIGAKELAQRLKAIMD